MKLVLMFIVASFVGANAYVAAHKDDYQLAEPILTCDENDPNLNDCTRNVFQTFVRSLREGNPKLFIQPQDPYVVKRLTRDFNLLGLVDGNLKVKGVKISGTSDGIIHSTNVKITDDRFSMDVLMTFPRVTVEGKYKSEIKIYGFPMAPKGHFNITMNEAKVTISMTGKFITTDGSKHLVLDKFHAEEDTDNVKIYATGLVPDPDLNDVVLEIMNQNWRVLMQIAETRNDWAAVVMDILNEFLQAVTFTKHINRVI